MKQTLLYIYFITMAWQWQTIGGAENPQFAGLVNLFKQIEDYRPNYKKKMQLFINPSHQMVIDEIKEVKQKGVPVQEIDAFLKKLIEPVEATYDMKFMEQFDNEITTIWTDQKASFDYLIHLMKKHVDAVCTDEFNEPATKDPTDILFKKADQNFFEVGFAKRFITAARRIPLPLRKNVLSMGNNILIQYARTLRDLSLVSGAIGLSTPNETAWNKSEESQHALGIPLGCLCSINNSPGYLYPDKKKELEEDILTALGKIDPTIFSQFFGTSESNFDYNFIFLVAASKSFPIIEEVVKRAHKAKIRTVEKELLDNIEIIKGITYDPNEKGGIAYPQKIIDFLIEEQEKHKITDLQALTSTLATLANKKRQ